VVPKQVLEEVPDKELESSKDKADKELRMNFQNKEKYDSMVQACKDDADCLTRIRSIMSKVGDYEKAGFNRETPSLPKKDAADMYGILNYKQ
jgi:hypothetical protein